MNFNRFNRRRLVKNSTQSKQNKNVSLTQIKTPSNVEEFRNNLRKYFVLFGGDDELYVQNPKKGYGGIKINELNSLDDLYDKCIGTPNISVKVNPLKDFEEFMIETNQTVSFNGYFKNSLNFEIIENQHEFMSSDKYSPKWIGIDNKIYREFFVLTLGKFSGYIFN